MCVSTKPPKRCRPPPQHEKKKRRGGDACSEGRTAEGKRRGGKEAEKRTTPKVDTDPHHADVPVALLVATHVCVGVCVCLLRHICGNHPVGFFFFCASRASAFIRLLLFPFRFPFRRHLVSSMQRTRERPQGGVRVCSRWRETAPPARERELLPRGSPKAEVQQVVKKGGGEQS